MSDKMREILPAITEDDRQLLHYNPNTDDLVEWAQEYALKAVQAAQSAAVPVVGDVPTAEQVGEEIGMHASAWDCVDPEKIIAAVLKLSKPATSITAAELDALRKDAERYRWLRDLKNDETAVRLLKAECDTELDEAIDAALAGEKKHG